MLIAKKYYLFHALDRKKAGLKWVRIAKKIDSSLLTFVTPELNLISSSILFSTLLTALVTA